MSSPLLELSVREKRYAATHVIGDVDFALRRGEIVSLVGPSGCGKSTLLRIVAALDTQYRGDVLVDGEPPRLNSRNVGFIFQEPRLLPWLTVAENVGFDAGFNGVGGRNNARVQALLAEVGLTHVVDAYPRELSGGMAQRVAIARGLYTQPQILLLDEPFSAVDAFTRMRLQDLLLDVARRHDTTLLLVTHDIGEAVYLSDRVIALNRSPATIAGELAIDLAHPRDRRDVRLARFQAQVLDWLDDHAADRDVPQRHEIPWQADPQLSRLAFAI